MRASLSSTFHKLASVGDDKLGQRIGIHDVGNVDTFIGRLGSWFSTSGGTAFDANLFDKLDMDDFVYKKIS